jgi:hypothetical protein
VGRKPKRPEERQRPGRKPNASPALAAAVANVLAGGSYAAAVERHGVPDRTLRDHVERARAAQVPAGGAALVTTAASLSEQPNASPRASGGPSVAKVVASTKLPQGGEVAERADLLALVHRILDARHPAARRELDNGLVVFGRGGEEALGLWLARPIAYEAIDPARLHEYAADLLAATIAEAKVADPTSGRKSALLEKATALFRELRQQLPDQRGPSVEERVAAAMAKLEAEAHELTEQYVAQAEEEAARPTTEAPFGRCVTCETPLREPLGAPP